MQRKVTDRSVIIYGNNVIIFFPLQSMTKINFPFGIDELCQSGVSSHSASST